MDENKLVKEWARWSKMFMRKLADERGVTVISHHDEELEELKKSLRVHRVDANPSLVAGLAFAFQRVVSDEELGPATKHRLALAIAVQAGLVAEAAQNTFDNLRFAAITSRFSAMPATEPWGGLSTRTVALRGTFSCNKHGDVWRPPGYGFTAPHERTNLKGTDLRLDAVVRQVLQERPAGGRFEVNPEGVFLADGNIKVA